MATLGTRPALAPPSGPGPGPRPAEPVELASVRIVAVGDVLMHQDVQRSAREAETGLRALWADVEPLIRGADIAFANLETPVAPTSGEPGRPFRFNAPAELPAALKASGFTVLSTANNHAYDQGSAGVVETLRRLRAAQLVPVGTGSTRAEAEQVQVVQANGLRVAFLGFTDLYNINLNDKASGPWVRGLDPAAAAAAVRAARAQADAVVVSIHWGVEYQHVPLPRQREVALQLCEAGADLILGTHPHALQPVELLEHNGHRTLVAFSMGNFVSNQDRMYLPDLFKVDGGDSRDGVALQCRLVRQRLPDGSVRVTVADPVCEPLWNLNNWQAFMAGEAKRRVIRVLWVNAAIAAAQADLARLGNPPADPEARRQAQDLLNLLQIRRARATECLGTTFVRQ